ncbi:MAG: hypothetical protein KBI39_03180 [Firmicutes bacterium]|nr:hypothetical protein [Candidatus Fermentithermobacillaceae bacterium]
MADFLADLPTNVKNQITLVRKTRKLPLPGEVLVKVGDIVKPDTPIAKIAVKPGIPWVIPAARLLGVEPAQLSKSMLKEIGDSVKTKEVFARAEQGLYGRKELESPTDGVIESISDRSGRVTIREEFGKEEPPVTFDVAFEIKCKPEELPQHMLRTVGQEVKKDQMIAKKGEAQAFFTKTALAPVSGIISDIDTKTGKVTISRPFREVIVNAYIEGRVSEVMETRGCVIETPGIKINGIFGLGRETHGEIRVLVNGPDQVLEADMITSDCKDKIIIGGSFATNDALSKAIEVGAKGVVTGTANYFNLTQSLGVKLGIGITGQEDIPLTVILMEGFGHLNMRREVWETLAALEGMTASMNGATQIRAGAIRPEIIVSFFGYEGELAKPVRYDIDLKQGAEIRIVSEPYFGAVGTIAEITKEPMMIETEAKVPVVKVLLANGEQVVVPRANVEML